MLLSYNMIRVRPDNLLLTIKLNIYIYKQHQIFEKNNYSFFTQAKKKIVWFPGPADYLFWKLKDFVSFLEIKKIVEEIRGVLKKQRGLKEDLQKTKTTADNNFSKCVSGTKLFFFGLSMWQVSTQIRSVVTTSLDSIQ